MTSFTMGSKSGVVGSHRLGQTATKIGKHPEKIKSC